MENNALAFAKEPSLWRQLAHTEQPLVLYGMGDGADKLIARLAAIGRKPDGIFASDEFVRGQSFAGHKVLTLAQAEQCFGDMCVLVSFGTEDPAVLARIYSIAARHKTFAPHLPLFGDALFDENFVAVHKDELLAADELWADEASKVVYRSYLAYMWSGNISNLQAVESPREAAWRLLNPGTDEVFWDLGAYDGDTVADFMRLVDGRYRQIVAVEPDEKNCKKLRAALADIPRAQALPYAVWHTGGTLDFAGKAGRNSAVAEAAAKKVQSVAAVTLDDLLAETGCPPTFIKFDVEGAEEAALHGGAALLAKYRPKLALSCYHRTEDIYRLPLLLKQLAPAYRLYLRHHPYVPGWETNIYAF